MNPFGTPETYEIDLPLWAGVALTTADWSDLDHDQANALRKFLILTDSEFGINDRPCFWYIEHNDDDELQYWENHDLAKFGIGSELCVEMTLAIGTYN
jgi:hypothetical protein